MASTMLACKGMISFGESVRPTFFREVFGDEGSFAVQCPGAGIAGQRRGLEQERRESSSIAGPRASSRAIPRSRAEDMRRRARVEHYSIGRLGEL